MWALSRLSTYTKRVKLRRRALENGRYDLAHIQSLNYLTDWRGLAEIDRRVPLISTIHDVVPHQPRIPAQLERVVLGRMYAHAGHMLVAHDYLARRLVDEFGVDADRIHVIEPPIRSVEERVAKAARPTVLFFGTFRRNKGLPTLLEAISLLTDLNEVRFKIAGRGVSDLEELVHNSTIRDPRIDAEIGFIAPERREQLYSSSTLVVLPYISFSSQSAVLRDAYAHRIPVVVTDVGALGETVRTDGTGWVAPPGDSAALASSLRLALDDTTAREFASQAMYLISKQRTVERTGEKLRALYDLVTKSHRVSR